MVKTFTPYYSKHFSICITFYDKIVVMDLKKIYSSNDNKAVISFEVFPPKDDIDGLKLHKLITNLKVLKKYNPALISLTYGAGGTNRDASLNIISMIQQQLQIPVMPHFTCVCADRQSVKNYLNEIQKLNIENILALRGDVPEGCNDVCDGFKYANELVEFIRQETTLSIGVAGYPEGHIACDDLTLDLIHLKKKIDAGADVIYTQMFFDNAKFFKFCERAQKRGIETPIIPGILPISNYSSLNRMLSMARVTLPDSLMYKLEKFKDNHEDVKKVGIEFAINQCQELLDNGVDGLHFFTLNTSASCSQILDNLNISLTTY